MKKVYWRPTQVSRVELMLIALVAVGCLAAVEVFKVARRQPFYEDKLAAARLARTAMETLRTERLRRGFAIQPDVDPAETGLIGDLLSPITSNTGHLPSKQAASNPNMAGVVVHYLKRAGVEPGDVVAVGCSGSFPGLNVAAYAALQTLKVRPIVITSVAASQWGANNPSFTWLDMEKVLYDRHVFSFRSTAASRGGIDDRGLGLSKEGRHLLDDALARSGVRVLQPKSYQESVEARVAVYQDEAGNAPVKAYINIGGGTSSVGTKIGKLQFKPGLNTRMPAGDMSVDSVMVRFVKAGVPVIHMIRMKEFAERFDLPAELTTLPAVGTGGVFVRTEYNWLLAALSLVAIFAVIVGFLRLDLGIRLFGSPGSRHPPATTREPMV